ncbi:MAG: hypothetical protein AAFW75_26440 [Cyanobacteria bacterium J06636_16]
MFYFQVAAHAVLYATSVTARLWQRLIVTAVIANYLVERRSHLA